ncbi:MAG: hypothetical protein E5X65_36565 [Mesorhizobium sp.]|nr:MAG: hypothetical protein E5X65_36565 [Mesorhizobium sp.]
MPIANPAWPLEDDDVHRRPAPHRHDRAMVLDGPMTGEWFVAYVEQVLAPTLRPDDVVILDNLPAHKSAAARAAIEATGARMMFLPPLILRKAAARTIAELWDTISAALPCFTPTECANYFAATG